MTSNRDVREFSQVTAMTDNVNNDRSWLAYVWKPLQNSVANLQKQVR